MDVALESAIAETPPDLTRLARSSTADHKGQEPVPWVPKLSQLLRKSRIYKLTHLKFNKKCFSDVGEEPYQNEQKAQDPEPSTRDAVIPALGSIPNGISSGSACPCTLRSH